MSWQTRPSPRGRLRAVVATTAVLACVAALATGPASAADDSSDHHHSSLPKLRGWVGPGFEISINRESVPADRYRMIVRDRGTIHNFHFFGPGVDRQTSIPGTGRHIWRVTLEPGTYVAACIPHGSMQTSLMVT